LTVPTAKPVADFHRQVIAHAGRTTKIKARQHPDLYSAYDFSVEPVPKARAIPRVQSVAVWK
ncbi:hypothetical protein, partial [Paenibacillus ehimensis]